MAFSAPDEDHDLSATNCAAAVGFGGWFNGGSGVPCADVNFFGKNYNAKPAPAEDGVTWRHFDSMKNSLSSLEVSLKPKDNWLKERRVMVIFPTATSAFALDEIKPLTGATTGIEPYPNSPFTLSSDVAKGISLNSKTVLLCGGDGDISNTDLCLLQNMGDAGFSAHPSNMILSRSRHSITKYGVSKAWISGGETSLGGSKTFAFMYLLEPNRTRYDFNSICGFAGRTDRTEYCDEALCLEGPLLPTPLSDHCFLNLNEGKAFLSGGLDAGGNVHASTYIYDPDTYEFNSASAPSNF